ncbi:MAG: M6 family metalloprotease domain-containing protein [Prevotellaceae bacterium]|jgi:M6 family metalloprotease-like protein|nr:M6 family metalloprotease domain-containing protein [Prevotellaceae bacterium]
MKNYLLLLLFCLNTGYYLSAVPAAPYPVTITQPDGTELTIRLHGDEFFSYKTTLDGYLVKEDEKGVYRYATLSDDGLVSTGIKANDAAKRDDSEMSFLKNLSPNPDMQRLNVDARRIKAVRSAAPDTKPSRFPLKGKPKSLVILVSFSDVDFVVSNPNEAFSNLLNENNYSANGGTGSARDYFKDSSSEAFDPDFVVVGPYVLPNTMRYYGENDRNSGDVRPAYMVVDACRLASEDGVDFSEYDTDGDGRVDNVFVYYAGYNEAEYGPKDSIWPHRWVVYSGNYNGSEASVTFDGKRIYDYACTSELRGSDGQNMCGVGTFVHEFGHVLGLPDFYATNNAAHTTMAYWDVMDTGPYLNNGRTPPAYSAYERFFLDWLTPKFLNTALDIKLEDIKSANTAYLITEGDMHNLQGMSPNPTEFFMLENRQKNGWDAYLPGNGLLITRINYSHSAWTGNTVNNDANRQGVEIMSANGRRNGRESEGGVTFPGTTKVTSYKPKLRNGNEIDKPLTQITELSDGTIYFKFMGGADIPAPVANDASNIDLGGFAANWEAVDGATGYYLSIYTKALNGQGETVIQKYIVQDMWLTETVYDIRNLASETEYYYTVKSVLRVSDTNAGETVSEKPSNEIMVKTKKDENESQLRVTKTDKGELLVFLNPSDFERTPENERMIYVYNFAGQVVRKITPKSTITTIRNLPQNIPYILTSGKRVTKIIL